MIWVKALHSWKAEEPMDEMLEGQREPGPLKARKHDDLANELLDRMNRLHGRASG